MMAASGLTALALTLAAGAVDVPARASEPDTPPEVEVIALEADPYQRMTVPVTIQGQGPFRFMIDTGSQATVISHTLAERLQLGERRRATLVGVASSMPVETVDVAGFTIGSRSFYIQTAPLVNAAHIGAADGIIGLDSLQGQRVLFDFEHGHIAVADAETLGGNRGFEIVVKARRRLGQLIISRAWLDGVRTAVIIDTGAQGSIANPVLAARLRRGRDLGETSLTDINGQTLFGMMRLGRELRLGGARLRNLPMLIADSPTFGALGLAEEPALILGMSELRGFRRVAIDFASRKVLFDMPRDALMEMPRTLSRLNGV